MAIDTPPWAALLPRAPDPAQPQTPNQMLLLQANQLKLDEARRQQQGNNTIAQMFQNPANLQNGFPKQDAIAQAIGSGALPPSMGMELIGNEAKVNADQQRQAQAQIKQQQERAEAERKWQQDMIEAFAPANTAYNDTLKKTGSEQAAQAAAQAMRDEIFAGLKQNGTQTPEHIRMLEQNRQYNHQIASTNLLGAKGLAQEARADRSEGRADRAEVRSDVTSARGASADPKPFNVTGDDGKKTQQMLTYDKDKRQYFDLEDRPVEGTKVTPLTAREQNAATADQSMATAEAIYEMRQPPLSSYAMRSSNGPAIMEALKQLGDERGRPYDARKYSQAKILMDGYSRTTPNSPGGQILSANTAVQHIDQLQTLADALKNKDIPVANRVINYVQTQLGKPEVTNFDAAAGVVADEVIKSVIGSGAVFDRAAMQSQLTNTKSPEQMAGALNTIKGLMGGRLNSLRHQWTSTGLPDDDFQEKLTSEARDALSPYLKGGKKADAAKPDAATPAKPGEAAAAGGPQAAGGVPTYSSPDEFKKNPPKGYWRKPDDPPGMVRQPP